MQPSQVTYCILWNPYSATALRQFTSFKYTWICTLRQSGANKHMDMYFVLSLCISTTTQPVHVNAKSFVEVTLCLGAAQSRALTVLCGTHTLQVLLTNSHHLSTKYIYMCLSAPLCHWQAEHI